MNNYHAITVNPLVYWLCRVFVAQMFCFIISLNSTLAKSCYREPNGRKSLVYWLCGFSCTSCTMISCCAI